MKKLFLKSIAFLLFPYGVFSQTVILGEIHNRQGAVLPGVNVMIQGSFEGTSTDTLGKYTFTTHREGNQKLVASIMGYKAEEISLFLEGDTIVQNVALQEDSRQLGTVVITAGTFEAGDQRKSVTLRPLDIVTTPSAAGDIYGMLNSLPGAAIVGEDGRLFVRGGDGYESKTFIDGLMVRKPYSSSTPDLPSRGRFSPFLFSGTTFSTGGYSAEYGQALSSALILNTNAFPEHTQTELSMMIIGMGASKTLKTENASISLGVEFTNLEPYFNIVPQSYIWNRYPTSLGATLSGHRKTSTKGILKVFSTYSHAQSGLQYPDLSAAPGSLQDIALDNRNVYSQLTYIQDLNQWTLHGGLSFGYDVDSLDMKGFSVKENYHSAQGRIRLSRKFSDYLSLKTGVETSFINYDFHYQENLFSFNGGFHEFLPAVFVEVESRPLPRLALRTGLRHEYSSTIVRHNTAWRASAAWLISNDWQASLAAGSFYQTPEESILRYTTQLNFERSNHFIANIQYEKQNRILRMEAYHKSYHDLVTFHEELFFDPQRYHNNGNGFARGFDLFFRDRGTFRTLDYWISYSYLDAERIYRAYPTKVRPHFAPRHSFTTVAKKWVGSINTLFGATFTLASGRPYNDPNKQEFMSETTRGYRDISVNASHLMNLWGQQTILYVSVSNLLGSQNIFGYRYYDQPDSQGNFTALVIGPPAKRFVFVGLFVTIR